MTIAKIIQLGIIDFGSNMVMKRLQIIYLLAFAIIPLRTFVCAEEPIKFEVKFSLSKDEVSYFSPPLLYKDYLIIPVDNEIYIKEDPNSSIKKKIIEVDKGYYIDSLDCYQNKLIFAYGSNLGYGYIGSYDINTGKEISFEKLTEQEKIFKKQVLI